MSDTPRRRRLGPIPLTSRNVAVMALLGLGMIIGVMLIWTDDDGAPSSTTVASSGAGPAGPLDFAAATRSQIETASGLDFEGAADFKSLQETPNRLFVSASMSEDALDDFTTNAAITFSDQRAISVAVPGLWELNVDGGTYSSSVTTRDGVRRTVEVVRVGDRPVSLRIQLDA